MSKVKPLHSLVLAAATAATLGAAEAAPLPVASHDALVQSTGEQALVQNVGYYRRRYVGRRYYNPAGAAVAGAALGIIGAGIAAATAPRYEYYPAYGYGYAPYGYGYAPYGYGYGPYYGW